MGEQIAVSKIKRDAKTVPESCGMSEDEFDGILMSVLSEDGKPSNSLSAIGANLDDLIAACALANTVSEAVAVLFFKLGRARVSKEDFVRAFVLVRHLERSARESRSRTDACACGGCAGAAGEDKGDPGRMFA